MTSTDYTPDLSASPNQRYDALTQGIHWLSLVAIAIAFLIGLLLEDMPRGPEKTQLADDPVAGRSRAEGGWYRELPEVVGQKEVLR